MKRTEATTTAAAKRPPSRRNATPTSAVLKKELIEVLRGPAAPGDEFWTYPDDGMVGGISLPADLHAVAILAATAHFVKVMATGLSSPDGKEKLSGAVFNSIELAYRAGFAMAVRVYADDLRNVAAVASIRAALARGREKGGAANRKKAAPIHKAIRKLFRELRKTVPKKTARYLRIAKEYGLSDRQVSRIVDGID